MATKQQRKAGSCSRRCKGTGRGFNSCRRACMKGGSTPKRKKSRRSR